MSDFKLISAILRGNWLISDAWVNQHTSIIEALLEGRQTNFNSERKELALPSVLTQYHYREGWNKSVKGSIAMYDLRGPIMHYGYCADGTYEMEQAFKEAEANNNIIGHLFLTDTPGGQAEGTKEFADTILKGVKPSYSYINAGMVASGGMWITSATDGIYASSDLVEVGSIGAQSTLLDFSKYDEKSGIRRIVIRAKQSFDKNVVYDKAIEGDKDALKELEDRVSVLAESFINSVRSNRGERLTGSGWDSGKMFFAPQAIEIGLIDGIASLEDVISMIQKGKPNVKNSNNNMNKFNNVAALAGQAQVSQESLDLANADLTEAGITHVTLVEQSVLDEAVQVTADLALVRTELETANTTIADNQVTIDGQKARITTLEGVIANRAAADNGTKGGSNPTVNPEIETNIPETKVAAHNKIADQGFWGAKQS